MSSPLLASIFLLGASLITGISSAIQILGKTYAEELAEKQKGLAAFFFKKSQRNSLSFTVALAKPILLICYTLTAFLFCLNFFPNYLDTKEFLLITICILSIFFLLDGVIRFLSLWYSKLLFKGTCQIFSLYILPFYPLSVFLYKFFILLPSKNEKDSSYRLKDKILEILQDSEFSPYLDQSDQKLILSVVSFKEKIAREIMVPRIDMFTLSASTSVKKATEAFLKEEYSRIPIWKDTVDNIIGTLYYKDLFRTYHTAPNTLDKEIETLIKPIVYSPETKKISQLLQEFRTKQIHLAIVVDEYGGTEGIVTIEDILEELVGEIADETDRNEEMLYTPLSLGGWIIDARMTITAIEEELGIHIPQNPEYDTLGGFVFHKAGAIPHKGWRLHQNTFDLEVLSSSEKSIEKIRITPHY